MARASTITLLSLDRYAKILGINPVHFHGAMASEYFILQNNCSDLWVQYSWQFADSVGREDLARAIDEAEIKIAQQLGWFPAPKWISQDVRQYSRHHRRDAFRRYGRDVRGNRSSVKAEYAKIISPGRRATSAVSTGVTVTYSDDDGDGFYETATITAATTITNVNELFCFTAGQSGAAEWEIREPRRKSISGGVVTFVYYSWQMIDPDLWEVFPTNENIDGRVAINLDELTVAPPYTVVVSTVDVYRVYNDPTEVSVQMLWEPYPNFPDALGSGFCTSCLGAGCEACQLSEQDGCFHIRDSLRGMVVPTPGSYNATTGQWDQACFTQCREPDQVKLWYYCGQMSNDYLSGRVSDPLSNKWAYAIAQLATALIERAFCSCGNVNGLVNKWRTDISIQGDSSFQISQADLDDPIFGTRIGGIMAARTVRAERHRIRGGGAV